MSRKSSHQTVNKAPLRCGCENPQRDCVALPPSVQSLHANPVLARAPETGSTPAFYRRGNGGVERERPRSGPQRRRLCRGRGPWPALTDRGGADTAGAGAGRRAEGCSAVPPPALASRPAHLGTCARGRHPGVSGRRARGPGGAAVGTPRAPSAGAARASQSPGSARAGLAAW